MWVGNTSFAVLAAVVPQLFPDGRVAGRSWKPVLVVTCVGVVLFSIANAFRPGSYPEPYYFVTNPIGLEGAEDVLDLLALCGFATFGVGILAGVLSLGVRLRRAAGVERQQLKWVGAAVAFFTVCWLGVASVDLLGIGNTAVEDLVIAVSITTVPIAAAVAILRYHLYDIDRIINRTLVYGLLTVGLGAIYAGLVVGLQELLRPLNGGSDLAIVVTTLFVAAIFLPARRQVQEQVDLDTLRYELLAVVDETMAPTTTSLWLRTRTASD